MIIAGDPLLTNSERRAKTVLHQLFEHSGSLILLASSSARLSATDRPASPGIAALLGARDHLIGNLA
jgi:hypothetical protein